MKTFRWDSAKNEQLKRERGISFEMVLVQIANGKILDILEHPNQTRYPNQQIFVVAMGGYAYLVPYIESAGQIFLKTVIPSRKATKDYLKDKQP